jgi:hypothetical protein
MPQPTFTASPIDPETIRAYLETEYHVLGEAPFILRVGEASAALRAAHARQGVTCSTFITAGNPHSRILSASANAARQQTLAAELRRLQLAYVPGIGRHPANQWPGEESFLVFGLALEKAKSLATRFAQNGIIWSGADGVPQLVLLC